MPEISSAMDIYADEMTTHSALSPMLHVECSNEEIKSILSSLYENILNINDVLNVFSKAKNEGATHIQFDTTSGWDGDKGFCLVSSLIIREETDIEYEKRISLKNEADKNEAILKEKKEREILKNLKLKYDN